MRRSNYTIERNLTGKPLIIRDIGPWTEFLTVTNDAERLVQYLAERNYLPQGRRLLYYDSEGQLDEIFVRNGRFAGFSRPTEEIEKEV